MINQKKALSGLAGLDQALDYMRYGDIVVWQISDIDEYGFFVDPFVEQALSERRNVVYFRFGFHKSLIEPMEGVRIYDLDVKSGFESMVMFISDVIEDEGNGTHYIFDSMTDLQAFWVADWMMGNFFVVTAPEIEKAASIAYFAFTRNNHSFTSVARIRETASILIDVFGGEDAMYLQPLKVKERYLPTIFLPHKVDPKDKGNIRPLTNGISLARYYSSVAENGNTDSALNLDNWERFFMEKAGSREENEEDIRELCRMIFGADERILNIVTRNAKLQDLLDIKARMIGVGRIGGKATGMILSRLIVEKNLPDMAAILEPHDSFYISSNLYYTFLIRNRCWGLKIKQRKQNGYFTVAEIIKEKILEGSFSDNIREQFRRMLEYFGQSPIIVRSSSLLEDGFGNAFAGKYESVFCVNKGPLEERLVAFEDAVRKVYASTMDESVLEYRLLRGLSSADEQMALLVQRVSGSLFDDLYMPAAAGVAFSYNSYRWNKSIDPEAGMVRIVMGLGTRAVDRVDGDYPRIASLDNPAMQALNSKYVSDHSQKKVDVLDLSINAHTTIGLDEMAGKFSDWFKAIMIERDYEKDRDLKELGITNNVTFTTCDHILTKTGFVSDIRKVLAAVQKEYDYPVDMEFALNMSKDGKYVINLLQCRPLQVGGAGIRMDIPKLPEEKVFFHLDGGTMGGAYFAEIDVVVRIDPKAYYEHPYNRKSYIATLIGHVNQYYKDQDKVIMLMVPGRIGTSSPELGVPVKFAEISSIGIICEVSYEGAGYMPELSYGSHLFQDLVEADIFYASIFENKNTTVSYTPGFFEGMENMLAAIAGEEEGAEYEEIVQVYDMMGRNLKIVSDVKTGETLCGVF